MAERVAWRRPEREAARARRGGIEVGRIAGIRIRIDRSWIVIFLLVLWSLSVGFFPREYPDQPTIVYWAAGLLATLLFFLSILAHELAHSLVAQRCGVRVPAITLFLFGGISEMQEEPRSPSIEIRIAVVGPLSSLALAAIFWVLSLNLAALVSGPLVGVLRYLTWINAALGLFNLLPGLPLDGGRVLRAVVWRRTGSFDRATQVASNGGKAVALGLVALGALQILAGAWLGGIWFFLIGFFLFGLAQLGPRSLWVRRALENVRVDQMMIRDVVAVAPGTSVERLVDDYILGYGFRGFPVVEDGRVRGLISVNDVASLRPEEREALRVEERMEPLDPRLRIDPEAPLQQAARKMEEQNLGRLLVMRGDELLGMITQVGLGRFVELRLLLKSGGEVRDARTG